MLGFEGEEFGYQLQLGLPGFNEHARGTMFTLDPRVKEEYIWPSETKRRVPMLKRDEPSAWLRNSEGSMITYPFKISLSPSTTSSAKSRTNGSFEKREFADRGYGNPASHEPLSESAVYQKTQLVFLQARGRLLPGAIRERSPECLDARMFGLTLKADGSTLAANLQPRSEGGHTLNSDASRPVSELLIRWRGGDKSALDSLLPMVYDELRRLARHHLKMERPDHTLQSTALVHEAYLRLVGQSSLQVESRAHFFGIAAGLMREILVDHARRRGAAKRGADCLTLALDEAVALPQQKELNIIALDDALNGLAEMDARQSRIVELRFFGGLSIEETSDVLEISTATVKREWATARLWLQRELNRSEPV